jgi:hypothetical protein
VTRLPFDGTVVTEEGPAPDAEIRALVKRLARPHSSGGDVVERAALLASGSDFAAVMAWIADHAGVAEALAFEPPRRGLHGPLVAVSGGGDPRTPLRFVLPPGALA